MIPAALRALHLLALSVWIGSIVFFSFVTAPSLFAALPRDLAGRATAVIFPRYYMLGAACGALSILTSIVPGPASAWGDRLGRVELSLLVVMTILTLYAGQVILPEAARLRLALPGLEGTTGHDAARSRFTLLHGRSVVLNGVVLLLGIGALVLVSLRGSSGARGTTP